MDRLISLQAAIDTLNSLQKYSLIDSNEQLHGVGVRLKFAVQKLEQLPSAQPEPLTVNFAREMDKETIEKLKEGLKNAPVLIMAVNDSAQPEIIRCKDCVHRSGDYCHRFHDGYSAFIHHEDYCSYAERRTDETD